MLAESDDQPLQCVSRVWELPGDSGRAFCYADGVLVMVMGLGVMYIVFFGLQEAYSCQKALKIAIILWGAYLS